MRKREDRENIYLMGGKVNVEITKATKTLPGHWSLKDFAGAIVSGHTPDEAAKTLTAKTIFSGKDDEWKRKKKFRVISYHVIEELGKVNY